MDSEVDDLEALRKAALATLSNETKTAPKIEKEEDEDLDALRQAALITRKQKQIQVLQQPVRVHVRPALPTFFPNPPFNPASAVGNNLINLTPAPSIPPLLNFSRVSFPPRPPMLRHMPPPRPPRPPQMRPLHGIRPLMPPNLNQRQRRPLQKTTQEPILPSPKPKEIQDVPETKVSDKFSRYDPDSSSDEDDEHVSSKKEELEEESDAESNHSDAIESTNPVCDSSTKDNVNDTVATPEETPEHKKSPDADPPKTPVEIIDEEPVDVLTIMDEDDILLAIDDFLEDRPEKTEPKKSEDHPKKSEVKKSENVSTQKRKMNSERDKPKLITNKITFENVPVRNKSRTSIPETTVSTTKPTNSRPKYSSTYETSNISPSGVASRNYNKLKITGLDQTFPKSAKRENLNNSTPIMSVNPTPPRQRRDSDLDSVGSSELSFLSSDGEIIDSEEEHKMQQTHDKKELFSEKHDPVRQGYPQKTEKLDLRKKLEARGLKKNKNNENTGEIIERRNTPSPKTETAPQRKKIAKLVPLKNKKNFGSDMEKPTVHTVSFEKERKPISAKGNIRVKAPKPATKSEDTQKFRHKNETRKSGDSKSNLDKDKQAKKSLPLNRTTVKSRLGRTKFINFDASDDFRVEMSTESENKPARIVLKKASKISTEKDVVRPKVKKLATNVRTSTSSRDRKWNNESFSEDSSDHDEKEDIPECNDGKVRISSRIKVHRNASSSRDYYEDEDLPVQRDLTGIKRRIVISGRASPSTSETNSKKVKKSVKDRLGRKQKTDSEEEDEGVEFMEIRHQKREIERPRSSVAKLHRKPVVAVKKIQKHEKKLEARIQKIKMQNGRILQRQKEIQQEKEKFG